MIDANVQPVLLPTEEDAEAGHTMKREEDSAVPRTGAARFSLRKCVPFLVCTAIFLLACHTESTVASYLTPPPPPKNSTAATANRTYTLEARLAAARCLAVFVYAVLLWATGAIPLYITSLSIAPCAVFMRCFLDANTKTSAVLPASAAADAVLHSMGSDALFMVLGVYTLGSALRRTCFEKILQKFIFSIGGRSAMVLLGVSMLLSVLISAVISNVFAPVFMFSILQPIFDRMSSMDRRPLAKAIILAVSISSNIGGMPSPIASPQNIIARSLVGDIQFGEWLGITVPQCAVMLILGYLLVVARFKPYRYPLKLQDTSNIAIPTVATPDFIVLATFALTIYLWISPTGSNYFGNSGIVSIIPISILFATGVLSLNDFKDLPWNIVWLVAGGNALGEAIHSSHLLSLVSLRLRSTIEYYNTSIWGIIVIIALFMAIIAEGISHTVSSIIVLPLILRIGTDLHHPKLFVMTAVLACSGAMSLPVSSFPNMAAFGVRDIHGDPFLTPADILISGFPMTIACTLVISTIGYLFMRFVYHL